MTATRTLLAFEGKAWTMPHTDPTDPRPHVIVDATDLRVGDTVLAWDNGSPLGEDTVTHVDRRPRPRLDGSVEWHTDVTHAHWGTSYAVSGPRKITPRQDGAA